MEASTRRELEAEERLSRHLEEVKRDNSNMTSYVLYSAAEMRFRGRDGTAGDVTEAEFFPTRERAEEAADYYWNIIFKVNLKLLEVI